MSAVQYIMFFPAALVKAMVESVAQRLGAHLCVTYQLLLGPVVRQYQRSIMTLQQEVAEASRMVDVEEMATSFVALGTA
jgi:hypothetical protein